MHGCVSRAAAAVILVDRSDEGTGTLLGDRPGRVRVPVDEWKPVAVPVELNVGAPLTNPSRRLRSPILGWPLLDRRVCPVSGWNHRRGALAATAA